MTDFIQQIIYSLFWVYITYFLLLGIYYIVMAVIGSFQAGERHEEAYIEDYEMIYSSHFTLPVSVIIPACNEEVWIENCLRSVLNLKYPEMEVIVVDDGSTDSTLNILNDILKLKTISKSYVDRFDSGPVKQIFSSDRFPNVSVISKCNGKKKAGAINAGLNFAKYKYVCTIDADTVLEPDALLKVMTFIEHDPSRNVGAGSYFGLSNGFKIKAGRIERYSFSYNPLIAYQNIEYLRSFIGNRLSWSRYNAMPCVSGGFAVWRRDILNEIGGCRSEFSSEDLELTFRVHDLMKHRNIDYRISMLPYYVGWTNGPATVSSLIQQRDRWQRVTNETVWAYKHMIMNPSHGALALVTLPYFLLYEVLGVFFEASSVSIVGWAAVNGFLPLSTFAAYFCFMWLWQTILTLFSIFTFVRDYNIFTLPYILYMIILSFLEFAAYRWIISIAKLKGTIKFLMGIKTHDQYKRPRI